MSRTDNARIGETATVGATVAPSEGVRWHCHTRVEKFWAGEADVRAGKVKPYETVDVDGNLLVNGGGDVLWAGVIGNVVATSGLAYTAFNNGNAAIGVGNSTTAAAVSQTGLQAASSRRYHKGMEATYPTHTTGTASTAARNIVFRSLFSTAQANFAWNEWCVRNSTLSTGAGRMLQRKVQSLGTKSTAASWQLTVTLSVS